MLKQPVGGVEFLGQQRERTTASRLAFASALCTPAFCDRHVQNLPLVAGFIGRSSVRVLQRAGRWAVDLSVEAGSSLSWGGAGLDDAAVLRRGRRSAFGALRRRASQRRRGGGASRRGTRVGRPARRQEQRRVRRAAQPADRPYAGPYEDRGRRGDRDRSRDEVGTSWGGW